MNNNKCSRCIELQQQIDKLKDVISQLNSRPFGVNNIAQSSVALPTAFGNFCGTTNVSGPFTSGIHTSLDRSLMGTESYNIEDKYKSFSRSLMGTESYNIKY